MTETLSRPVEDVTEPVSVSNSKAFCCLPPLNGSDHAQQGAFRNKLPEGYRPAFGSLFANRSEQHNSGGAEVALLGPAQRRRLVAAPGRKGMRRMQLRLRQLD